MTVPYIDVERVLVAWLTSALGVRVLTDLPADLQKVVPVLQIARFGGADTRPGLDVATLDVDAYGADRAGAIQLAEEARYALRFQLPGTQIENAVFTQVITTEAPGFRPYDNTALRRFGGSYQVFVHMVAL